MPAEQMVTLQDVQKGLDMFAKYNGTTHAADSIDASLKLMGLKRLLFVADGQPEKEVIVVGGAFTEDGSPLVVGYLQRSGDTVTFSDR